MRSLDSNDPPGTQNEYQMNTRVYDFGDDTPIVHDVERWWSIGESNSGDIVCKKKNMI